MVDKKITMNINEVLELDYIAEEISNNVVSYQENPSGTPISYLSKESAIFNPDGKGIHKIEINGKIIEIDVIGLPSSVIHQYDASQLGEYTDGEIVNPFTDSIGESDLLPQGTNPLYKPSVQNGKAVVRTDGSDDVLSISASKFNAISAPLTVIAVVSSVDKDASSNRTITSVSNTGDDNAGAMIWNNSGYFEFVGGPSGNNTSAPIILTGIVDGSDTVIRENGTQTGSGSRSGSMDSLSIGQSGSGSWIANNDYCEVLIYNGNLSKHGDLSNEEDRLANKWGITI